MTSKEMLCLNFSASNLWRFRVWQTQQVKRLFSISSSVTFVFMFNGLNVVAERPHSRCMNKSQLLILLCLLCSGMLTLQKSLPRDLDRNSHIWDVLGNLCAITSPE